MTVKPGEHYRFWHGFALEFPEGYGAIIMDKSSISKAGLAHLGGIFDAGYRREYNTHLVNLSDRVILLKKGDKSFSVSDCACGDCRIGRNRYAQ